MFRKKIKHKKGKITFFFLSYRPEDVVESGNSGTTYYQVEHPIPGSLFSTFKQR